MDLGGLECSQTSPIFIKFQGTKKNDCAGRVLTACDIVTYRVILCSDGE